VIVGAGAAGAIAAETLREEGFQGRVTLLEGEPSGPVDRPNLSKDYLAGNAPEEWIPLRSGEFYRERDIELRVGTRATPWLGRLSWRARRSSGGAQSD
jgi:apoptosis-inducing factor 3